MAGDRDTSGRGVLVAAVVGAGALGLGLTAFGWWIRDWGYRDDWGRLGDPGWWAGSIGQGLGQLAFGRFGFKAALLLVAAVVGVTFWLRGRRRSGPTPGSSQPDGPPSTEAPSNEVAGRSPGRSED